MTGRVSIGFLRRMFYASALAETPQYDLRVHSLRRSFQVPEYLAWLSGDRTPVDRRDKKPLDKNRSSILHCFNASGAKATSIS